MLYLATALAGFGIGLRAGMTGLVLAALGLCIAMPAALVALAGSTVADAALTTGGAVALFGPAAFASMIVRHHAFGSDSAAVVRTEDQGSVGSSRPALR